MEGKKKKKKVAFSKKKKHTNLCVCRERWREGIGCIFNYTIFVCNKKKKKVRKNKIEVDNEYRT